MGVGAMVLKPAMITTQLFFQADYCLIGAVISVRGLTLGMKRNL